MFLQRMVLLTPTYRGMPSSLRGLSFDRRVVPLLVGMSGSGVAWLFDTLLRSLPQSLIKRTAL
jgi:hypothetical protein